jgi:anaerobic dimethyl sulfoxide reductase subunit C (anchor subunit)
MQPPDHEWSLIIFNILGQLSVGAFLALGIAHFYAVRKAGLRHADLLSTRALIALGPILVLGMLAVFGHVGNPERVFNMLSNLDTSWLAREVAAYGVFLVLGGIFAVLQAISVFVPEEKLPLPEGIRKALPTIRIILAWLAALLGLLFVLSAAMIYFDPRLASRQTGWAHIYTPILFFTDMGMLGALSLGTGFVINYLWLTRGKATTEEDKTVQLGLLRDCIKGTSFVAIALIGVLFVVIPIYLVYLGTEGGDLTTAILTDLHTTYATLWFLRLFLAFTGAGVLSAFAWYFSCQKERDRLLYLFVIGAFVCVLISEFLARYLFYARNATLLIGGHL